MFLFSFCVDIFITVIAIYNIFGSLGFPIFFYNYIGISIFGGGINDCTVDDRNLN